VVGGRNLSKSLLLGGRRRRKLEFCVVGHHSLESDTDTFDDGQEDGTHNSGVAGSLDTSSDSQRTTGEETGDNGIVRIFLLADALDGTVEG
jgi:hypothetical protein